MEARLGVGLSLRVLEIAAVIRPQIRLIGHVGAICPAWYLAPNVPRVVLCGAMFKYGGAENMLGDYLFVHGAFWKC